MTDQKPENDTVDFQAEDGAAEAAAEAAGPDRLAELEAENAELKDRALRLMAEMENLRRRTAKEVKDASQYGITGFARDMLGVSDNLRRALDAVPKDAAEDAEPTLKALLEGVEMTEREMLNALEKHGVRKIEPDGEKFDPNFHQAMFEVPNPDVPNGTVVQVMQAGYVIGERVLRPAMVGVAKGGPKAPKPDTDDAAAEASGQSSPEEPEDEQSAGARVDRTA